MANYSLNRANFTKAYNADIQKFDGTNISEQYDHLTSDGIGNGAFDYYEFTANAGEQFIFDLDNNSFDTELFLLDSSGSLLATNDDGTETGNTGTTSASFITHTFTDAGTYRIAVGKYIDSDNNADYDTITRTLTGTPPASGDTYKLHVSYGIPATNTFNNVDTFEELRDALSASKTNGKADIINITGDITLSGDLPLINEDVSLTINGGNFSISGGNTRRIFFVKSGNIVLDDLTLKNGRAQGTDGNGGGAGMGGALFIYGGNVTVSDTTFLQNQAIGGNGGVGTIGGGIGLNFLRLPFNDGTAGTIGSNGRNGLGGLGGYGGLVGFGGYGGNGGNGDYGGYGGNGGIGGFGGGGGGGGNGGGGGYGGIGGIGGIGGNGGGGGFGGGGGGGGLGARVGGNGGNGGNGGYGGGGGFGGRTSFGGRGGNGGRGGFGSFDTNGAGMGGAIFIRSGNLALSNNAFTSNTAVGGGSSLGLGGAIFAMKSTTNSNGNNLGMPSILPTVNLAGVQFSENDAAFASGNTTSGTIASGTNLNNDDMFGNTFVGTVGTPTLSNSTPIANNDTGFNTNEDTPLTIAISSLLANDTDVDSNPLTLSNITQPLHGTLTNDNLGNLIYTPTANYNGTDSFTYLTNDGTIDSNSATVTLNINAVNDAPTVANPISNQTAVELSPFTYTLPANTFTDIDGDTLTYSATLDNGNPLPAWLTFNANTKTFSGNPPLNTTALNLKVTASDGTLNTTNTFTLNVNQNVSLIEGNDTANIFNFSNSSRPTIIYGYGGNDNLTGGTNDDKLYGSE